MASHDNFGLWQHLRFLIPKRNWVESSLFIAGFGKGVAETAKEWEEVGWRKLLLESGFSHPPNSPSFILPRSLNTPKTTPRYRVISILSLANGSRIRPRRRQGYPKGWIARVKSISSMAEYNWCGPRSECTICFLSSRSVKGKTSGKRRKADRRREGERIGRGKGREILRRSGRRWRVRERGRRAAISRSTGNARGNEARPARTSGTWTFLRPRERLFLFFSFHCAQLPRFLEAKGGTERWHDCFVAPGHCGRICFLSLHSVASESDDSL